MARVFVLLLNVTFVLCILSTIYWLKRASTPGVSDIVFKFICMSLRSSTQYSYFVPLSVSPDGPHAPTTSVRSVTKQYFLVRNVTKTTKYTFDEALAVCKQNNGDLPYSWGYRETTSSDAMPREILKAYFTMPVTFWTRTCRLNDFTRFVIGKVDNTSTYYGVDAAKGHHAAEQVICERGELKLVTSIACSS